VLAQKRKHTTTQRQLTRHPQPPLWSASGRLEAQLGSLSVKRGDVRIENTLANAMHCLELLLPHKLHSSPLQEAAQGVQDKTCKFPEANSSSLLLLKRIIINYHINIFIFFQFFFFIQKLTIILKNT